ncbi:MAG: hypothetical protein ACFFB0_18225 [Promethearchaeota archaeon]
MDWSNIFENIYVWYNEFVNWYILQPIYVQILSVIGILTLLSLAIVLIFYLIKGIAYLIYYILKGIYYLLKGIGYGFFKLSKGFYNLISGKSNSKQQKEDDSFPREESNRKTIMYCPECGKSFSEKMIMKLKSNELIFCVNCGKQFKLIEPIRAPIITK